MHYLIDERLTDKQLITQVVVGVGSNHHANININKAIKELHMLGVVVVSTPLINPDITATLTLPKPDYTNLCAFIILHRPSSYALLTQQFKQIEQACGRFRASPQAKNLQARKLQAKTKQTKTEQTQHCRINQVGLDIDVLAIKANFIAVGCDTCDGDNNDYDDSGYQNDDNDNNNNNEKNKANLAEQNNYQWQVMKRRLPFKPYETFGLNELISKSLNEQELIKPLEALRQFLKSYL